MKNNMTFRIMGAFLSGVTKKAFKTEEDRRTAMGEYRRVCHGAEDIGAGNPLLSCYAIVAWFIAINRCNDLSPEDNYSIMERGMRDSRLFRKFMGSGESYIKKNKSGKIEKWQEKTVYSHYDNDWHRELIDPCPGCKLAFDFTRCGICSLCRDEGCPELAPMLCRMDYMMADVMGLRLERSSTLAEGGERCDFRYYYK